MPNLGRLSINSEDAAPPGHRPAPAQTHGGANSSSAVGSRRGSGAGPVDNNSTGLIRNDFIPPGNTIDLNKLRDGTELRCSCMLKNVPNRVSAEELMAFIDKRVRDDDGKRAYDAFYLRIDFKNNVSQSFGYQSVVRG